MGDGPMSQGQSVHITAEDQDREALVIDFAWESPNAPTAIFLFLLDETGKFRTTKHFVNLRTETTHGGFVRLQGIPEGGTESAQVQFHLASAGSDVHKVLMLLGVAGQGSTLADVESVGIRAWNSENGAVDISFDTPRCGIAKCVILAELELVDHEWVRSCPFEARSEALYQLANKIGMSS